MEKGSKSDSRTKCTSTRVESPAQKEKQVEDLSSKIEEELGMDVFEWYMLQTEEADTDTDTDEEDEKWEEIASGEEGDKDAASSDNGGCEEESVSDNDAVEPRQNKEGPRLTFSDDDNSDNETTDISRVKKYERLMRELRPRASRAGLTDSEILMEFKMAKITVQNDCSGRCICSKKGLKYVFYLTNKNVEDKFCHRVPVGKF